MRIIFLVFVLIIGSAHARDFSTKESISTITTSNYQFIKNFNLNVLSIDPFSTNQYAKATVIINGKTKTIASRLISKNEDNYTSTYKYEAIIQEDILADGFSCEESEVITYHLIFNLIHDRFDPYIPAQISEESLKAMHTYSWDICHDTNPIYKTIIYN